MPADEIRQDSRRWIKWFVIGGIGLVFMFTFKDEISALLGRTEEVKFTAEGVFIKVRTAATPLGEVLVSNIRESDLASDAAVPGLPHSGGAGLRSYSSDGFVVSWPDNGRWRIDKPFVAEYHQFGLEFLLRYDRSFDGFNPNVNVGIEEAAGKSYEQWLASGNAKFELMGAQVLRAYVDNESRGAVRVVLLPDGVYQIQRVLMRAERAYVITATTGNTSDAALSNDMLKILNSFRLS